MLAFERRVDRYTNHLAGGERNWEGLEVASAEEARRIGEKNARVHGAEDKEFVLMFRS